MYRKICVAILSVLFLVPAVLAAVPGQMNFQGVLKDSAGNNITGAKKMTFAIYTAATGGTAVWTEVQNSVSVEAGLYSVQLGSATAMPSSIFDGSIKYLGVAVDPDSEMTPRVVLAAMPYAFRADYAANSESFTGTVTTPQIADLAVTSTKIASNAVTSVQIADNAVATSEILAGAVVKDKISAANAPIGGQSLAWNGSQLQWTTYGGIGTVTTIETGPSLTGGPISTTGTIDVADGGITGAKLNPSVYATASTPNTLVSRDASGTFSASRIWVGTGEADSAGSKLIIYGDDSSGVRTTVRNIHINGKAAFRTMNDANAGAFGMYGSSVSGGYPPNYMYVTNNTATAGIAFITGGDIASNEAMRITSGRNVGIGTKEPQAKLAVAGTIETISGGIKFPDGTTQMTVSTIGAGTFDALETTVGGLTLFGGQAIKPSVDSPTAWGFSSSATPDAKWLNVDTTNKGIQINNAAGGATAPLSQLEITNDGINTLRGIMIGSHVTGVGRAANVNLQRSDGTKAAPTAVGDQWAIGALWGQAHDGNDYLKTAGVGFVTNGTIGIGNVPTDFIVAANSAGSAELLTDEKFRVTSAGRVGIQNSAPAQLLEVGRPTYDGPAYVRATSATNKVAGFSWGDPADSLGIWNMYKMNDSSGDLRLNNRGSGPNFPVISFRQNGSIAIGDLQPVAQLHQEKATAEATYHKFTAGTTTGQGTFDGFDVGINGSGNAELRQWENLPMTFYTNNSAALTLESSVATFAATVDAVSYKAGGTAGVTGGPFPVYNNATPGQLTSITIKGGIVTGTTIAP